MAATSRGEDAFAPVAAMTTASLTAGQRALLGGQLTAAMTAATLMQFVLAAFGPILIGDLGLRSSQLGLLHTAYFAAATAASLWVGGLTDRLGGKRLLRLMLLWQAAAFALMAALGTVAGVLAAAVLAGLGTAGGNPATNLVAMGALPDGRRGPLLGLKQSGPWVGAVLSGSLLVPLAIATSWRVAVMVVAASIAALVLMPIPAARQPLRPRPGGARTRLRELPASVRWLVPYALLLGLVGAGVSSYLTVFAVDALGYTEQRAGLALSTLGISAVAARVAWGRLGDRWRWRWSPLRTIAVSGVPFLLLLIVAEQQAVWGLWVAAVGLGATVSAWNTVGMLHVTSVTADQDAGRASGLVLTGFYGGLLIGPTVVGGLVELTGSYATGWGVLCVAALAAIPTARG